MKRPKPFYGIPFSDVNWIADDRPLIIVDGTKFSKASLSKETSGEFAYGVGLKDADIEKVGRYLKVSALSLYDVRATSLRPLEKMESLTKLSIEWARKLEDLSFLNGCKRMETLILSDLGRINSIEPVSSLNILRHLEVSGGIESVAKFQTLKPISSCKNLSTLCLSNIRVSDDDLQFVSELPNLKELDISNQWPTEQYALLSKKLYGVECSHLKLWIRLECPIGNKDTMVVGRGKPFLNSADDSVRIRSYEEKFWSLTNG